MGLERLVPPPPPLTQRPRGGGVPMVSPTSLPVVSPMKLVASPAVRTRLPSTRIGRESRSRVASSGSPVDGESETPPSSGSPVRSPPMELPRCSSPPPTLRSPSPAIRIVLPAPTASASPAPRTTCEVPWRAFSTPRRRDQRGLLVSISPKSPSAHTRGERDNASSSTQRDRDLLPSMVSSSGQRARFLCHKIPYYLHESTNVGRDTRLPRRKDGTIFHALG